MEINPSADESRKFVEAHPDYITNWPNFYALMAWILEIKLNKHIGQMGSENAFKTLEDEGLWKAEVLHEAYQDLSARGLLDLVPGREQLDTRPLAIARKEISKVRVTTITKKDIEEAVMACKAEMHLHYFMTAQDCLTQAGNAVTLAESLEKAAEGLVALDNAEKCGAPVSKTRDLEKKLKEVALTKV